MKVSKKSVVSRSRFWMWMVLGMIVVSMGVLGGCNTMEGAGKDVEKAGESIQDAAD